MSARGRLLVALSGAALAWSGLAHAQEPAAAPTSTPATETSDVEADPAQPADDPSVGSVEATSEPAMDVAPAGEESFELTAAELAELGLGAAPGETTLDTSLKFWGFADFTVETFLGSKSSAWRGVLGRYPSFSVGSFNLYMSKNITERIRTMGEVRFAYLPNGTVSDARTGTRVSTIVSDYSTNNRGAKWGGIMLQRIYVEAAMHHWATLRIGQFLTPYGIWNIDHGSPTFVPVQRPTMLNQQLFPESQTGFELFGRGRVSSDHVLGYHLTLSNGFGPISEYRDLDRNKAVGGRVFWQYDGFGQMQVGGSAFYGRDTESTEAPGLSPEGKYQFTETISRQADILALGADVRWTFGGLLLQSEILSQQRKYTDKGRTGSANPLLQGRWVAPQDDIAWGVYGLVGYRFTWLGVMPYFAVSNFHTRDAQTLSNIASRALQGGLNIRAVDAFVVKLEYTHGDWIKRNFISNDPVQRLAAQVAWAF